ncbi:hypothetical protein GCM10009609_31230 [Pseudonocardia aurantiaca]|uniref:Uncharacterized protein n=1 Tax=Pseudonocardia aurantiaca TaxID=75290 RepID=A0ABW4FY17_9PSEU
MGLLTRATALVGAVVAAAVIAGCGGSVADADRREPVATAPRPQTPFCAAAEANVEAIRPLNELLARGVVPPDELADTTAAVRSAGAAMVEAAPNEIRADVERTVRALDMQLDVLIANGGDAAAMNRDPELAAGLSSPEFAGAGDRVRAYVERTCTTTTATRR